MSHNGSSAQWDDSATRRAMRLLCAQPPDIHDSVSTARALRLVWDILHRRGAQADVYQVPGVMPLLTVGTGPILLCTYIDDQSPSVGTTNAIAANVSGNLATGTGVTRMAGLLGALGPILDGSLERGDVTLVVEADRHLGSLALQSWLNSTDRAYTYAFWETADLPVRAPAIYQSSTGLVVLSVTLASRAERIESFYAGVLPDIGHRLTEALASLKSRDSEVLVHGFYDGVDAPNTIALDRLRSISHGLQKWISRGMDQDSNEPQLSETHLTLGVFCAPSITVRSMELVTDQPFLPRFARATVEGRIMPGQDAYAIIHAIGQHLRHLIPDIQVEATLIRQPYNGSGQSIDFVEPLAPVYPIAPGDSPAGIFGTLGIPPLGFATVSRAGDGSAERVDLASIALGSEFVRSLCNRAAEQVGQQR